MEPQVQSVLHSSSLYLKLSGIFLIAGQALSATPYMACITWISPIFLITSAILFLLSFEKMIFLEIGKTLYIRISQISMIIWGVSLSVSVFLYFFGYNLVLLIIIVVLIAISQFGGFFFANKVLNELELHNLQFKTIKSAFLLSFSFFGIVEIIPIITSRVLGYSLTRHPLSLTINLFGLFLSIGVAIILIIVSNRIISKKQYPVETAPSPVVVAPSPIEEAPSPVVVAPSTIEEAPRTVTTQVPPKQFCSNCGSGRKEEDKFCQNCGSSFE